VLIKQTLDQHIQQDLICSNFQWNQSCANEGIHKFLAQVIYVGIGFHCPKTGIVHSTTFAQQYGESGCRLDVLLNIYTQYLTKGGITFSHAI